MRKLFLAVFFIVILIPQSFADTSTEQRDQVVKLKAFVDSGIDYIKQQGADKAYAEFSNIHGKFRQEKFYLAVYKYDGTCLAHGVFPEEKADKNLYEQKDPYGTPYIKLMTKLAKTGGGFIRYYSRDPDTHAIHIRTAYVKPIDDNTFIVSGVYDFFEVPVSYDVKVAELETFVNTGIKYINEHGEEAAFKEFDNPEGKFVHGKSHLFVITYDGLMIVDAGSLKQFTGKNIYDLKDEFGTPFVRMYIEISKAGGGIAGHYWLNPYTHTIQYKINYIKPFGKDKLIGAGFYEE